ncbi:hypothetical protein HZA96_03415 [Candidatus Woesearchaeota archaeon]|nr:hypothetical protein [Candidatus Woesearchaeota archaeon]
MVINSVNFKGFANTVTTLLLTLFLSRSSDILTYKKEIPEKQDDLYSYQLSQESTLLQDAEQRSRLRNNSTTLDAEIEYYKSQDERGDPFVDASLEELLKVKIIGTPTYNDLEQLTAFFTDKNNKQRGYVKHFKQLGIKYIAVLDDFHDKSIYQGLAQIADGVLIIKSGLSERKGLIAHELMHFYEKWLERNMSNYSELKASLLTTIGPYDKVIITKENGNETVKSYKDSTSLQPKHGYVQCYGGKSFCEDSATYAETPFLNPAVFTMITNDFDKYQAKVDFFYKIGVFLKDEHEQYAKDIASRQEFISNQTRDQLVNELLRILREAIFPKDLPVESCANLSEDYFNPEFLNSQDLGMEPQSSCQSHGIPYIKLNVSLAPLRDAP